MSENEKNEPYYCMVCGVKHHRGKKYEEHKDLPVNKQPTEPCDAGPCGKCDNYKDGECLGDISEQVYPAHKPKKPLPPTIIAKDAMLALRKWKVTYSDGSGAEIPFTVQEELDYGVEIRQAEKLAQRKKPKVGFWERRKLQKRAKKYKEE